MGAALGLVAVLLSADLAEAQLRVFKGGGRSTFASNITPTTDDGAALGTTSLQWSDLFLASGGVINWNNGDITLTHSANDLTLAGGVLGVPNGTAAAPPIHGGTANTGIVFASSSVAFSLNGVQELIVRTTDLSPADDSLALGTTSLRWSDLFLASGAVINFNAGNMTVTHSAARLDVEGGALTWGRRVVSAASGTTTIAAAESGALFANTGTTGTTTFTLPAAAAGLHYCFVEAGDAAGELLINVQTGDEIVGKTDGSGTGTGIDTAAGTGIKNTALTNVKGDHTCLTALDATTWLMTSVGGTWASQ